MRNIDGSLLVLCFGIAACSSSPSGGEADAGPTAADADPNSPDAVPLAQRYSPLTVGATWSYQTTDKALATMSTRVHTVQAYGDLGGPAAGTVGYTVRVDKPSGAYGLNFYQDTGTKVLRLYDLSYGSTGSQKSQEVYSPSRLRVDEDSADLAIGATYQDVYTDEKTTFSTGAVVTSDKTDVWTVDAVAVDVTVPAGTFSCLALHRTNAVTGLDEHVFFSLGVGKIKEEDTSTLAELTSYAIP